MSDELKDFQDALMAEKIAREFNAAKKNTVDPTKAMETNGVAYFDIDGDPESIDVHKGEVPVAVVTKYMVRRLPGSKTEHGHHPGEILIHYTNWEHKPATFTTKVEVQTRK